MADRESPTAPTAPDAPTAPTAPAAPATKAARQARIAEILSREHVQSQEQLATLLARYAGMHVAQATLSRDLVELGVVRLRAADGVLVYALPGEPGGPGSPPGTNFDYPERTGPPLPPPPAVIPGAYQDPALRAPGGPATGLARSTGSADGAAGDEAASSRPAASVPGVAPGGVATGVATGASPARLTRYLKELLTSAEASANVVVLRTPAGAAQFLASAIDHAAWPAILGTVAGDDTVLVISRDPVGGDALAAEFRRLAGRRR